MSDVQAEKAISKAMNDLIKMGSPLNVTTVPEEALKCLLADGASRGDAPERIEKAIADMVSIAKLSAPNVPWKDWRLL